jgi:hypothetical protein
MRRYDSLLLVDVVLAVVDAPALVVGAGGGGVETEPKPGIKLKLGRVK